MSSLIELRRRIRAVKSTQQITRAMKAVAASKLRKAQDQILGARPFAEHMLQVLNGLATSAEPALHPLLTSPPANIMETKPTLLVIVTSDKGLCGSFNSTLLRHAFGYIRDEEGELTLGCIGRKGRDFFERRGFDVCYKAVDIFNDLRYMHAQAIAQMAIEQYTTGLVAGVHLLYNEFKSVIQQRVVMEQLLPVPRLVPSDYADTTLTSYLFEPTAEEILEDLLPRHVAVQIFRALLESVAAEHSARMTAMDAATKNASEMIDDLTLHMNKVRQDTITRGLIEVVSGAEAL